MKKMLVFFGIMAFAIGLNSSAIAMNCHGSGQQSSSAATDEQSSRVKGAPVQNTSNTVIYVGNKACPVTGQKIQEETTVTSEYDGKIYNFCCADCIDKFKKEPTKYIKIVEEEIKSTSKNEK